MTSINQELETGCDMKPKITPIDNEVELGSDEFIVSKTDTKGRFTYANRVFMSISGYGEGELLGVQHNIVRHPDMPRGVFKMLWETLQSGQEFFGYVKNLCADGSYYWVLANITLDYDCDKQLKGYYSVRRKPTKIAINTIKPIYKKMIEIENNSSAQVAADSSINYLKDELKKMGKSYNHFVTELHEMHD